MTLSKQKILGALLLSTAFIAPIASATNGLYSIGYGARQTGIAGSGVAFPQDPLIAAINPAGVVFASHHSEINLQYFAPMREYTIDGPGPMGPMDPPPFPGATVESDSESFFIPSAGFSWSLSPDASVGFAIYGNGGMNTDYASHNTPMGIGTFGGDHTGVNYAQLFANLSYSRKFADGKASWGISAIANYSYIKMEGLGGFAMFSEDPSHLSDKNYDHAFGAGLRVGVLGEVMPGLRLGASYQTKIKNTFDEYKGHFANNGEFDIPAVAQIGLAADVGPGVLTLDVQHIYYSDSDAIGNTSRTLLTGGMLGDEVGFGWEDMTIVKAGYTWESGSDWTWRLGASYGDQPIPDDEVTFNIIAPGTIEQHYTAGFSKKLDSGKEVNVAFMYAPEKCVSGNALFVPSRSVEICMDQYSIDVGMSF
jgi:long-chain fatty acid transport protein